MDTNAENEWWMKMTDERAKTRAAIVQRIREKNQDIDIRAAEHGIHWEYDEESDIVIAWLGKPSKAVTASIAPRFYVHYDPESYQILGFEIHQFLAEPTLTPNFDNVRLRVAQGHSFYTPPGATAASEAKEQLRELVTA